VFPPLSLIVSIIALKVYPKKRWAVAGLIIGGLETLYLAFGLICVLLFAK
jgi:hypothetical protein